MEKPFKYRKIDAEAQAAKLARAVRASDAGPGRKSTTRIEDLDDDGRTASERAALAKFRKKSSGDSKAVVAKRAKAISHAQAVAARLAGEYAGHAKSVLSTKKRVEVKFQTTRWSAR